GSPPDLGTFSGGRSLGRWGRAPPRAPQCSQAACSGPTAGPEHAAVRGAAVRGSESASPASCATGRRPLTRVLPSALERCGTCAGSCPQPCAVIARRAARWRREEAPWETTTVLLHWKG